MTAARATISAFESGMANDENESVKILVSSLREKFERNSEKNKL